jgi:hypothetical protein
MNYIYIGIILILLAIVLYLSREINHLRKEREYWIEVDEENERLRKKLGETE